jgi:hypothetical protein
LFFLQPIRFIFYFLGDDPRAWRTGVPNFGRVKYEAIYPGIDLIWHGNRRRIEHDFVIAPGGDPSRIRLEFAGHDAISIDRRGALVLPIEGRALRMSKPVAWQDANGRRREIACEYRIAGADRVAFQLDEYDRSLPRGIKTPGERYKRFPGLPRATVRGTSQRPRTEQNLKIELRLGIGRGIADLTRRRRFRDGDLGGRNAG